MIDNADKLVDIACNINKKMGSIFRYNMTISQQIEAELQGCASRGERPSYRLTLSAISEHFDASIQPARTAVESLLKDGWLLRDAERQLVLNPVKKGCSVQYRPAATGSRRDVETELTQMVIRASLRGESVFLREEESAEQLGVGRTVVRAILGRLSGRGVVEHVPRRGWRICAFSEARMGEYLEVRELLEIRALELSGDRLDARELERLVARNSPTRSGRVRIDNALHAYWIGQAGNRYISEFFTLHGQYYATLFDYASLESSVVAEMAEQHRAILQALLDGNVAAARRTLRHHIRSQRPNVAHLMERNCTETE